MLGLLDYRSRLHPWWRGALYYLFFWGASGMYQPFLSVYFSRLGLSGTQIGILWALVPLMAFSTAPLLSFQADKRGQRRNLVIVGLLVLMPLLLAFALPHSFSSLFLLMLLMAFVRGPIDPVGDALVARMASHHRLNYGGMRMWGSVGFALAAALFGMVWQRSGFELMFILSALMTIPILIMALTLEERAPEAQRTQRSLREVGLEPAFLTLAIGTFLFGTTLAVESVFASIYMDSLGGREAMVGALFGIAAISELPSMLYADRLIKRFGGAKTLMLAYALYGIAHLGYALTPSAGVMLLFGAVRGLGFGLFFVGTVRLIDTRTPPEWSGTLQSLIMGALAFGLARLIWSPLGGVIYDIQPSAVFLVSAALAGAGIGVLAWGRRYLED